MQRRGTGAKLCGCADLWGPSGAENGVLSIMCGGDQTAYDAAEPIMAAYSRICRRIGDSGAGQKTKMCNQIAIADWFKACQKRCILLKKRVLMVRPWLR